MKKLLLLFLLPFLFSCTNYYYVVVDSDTPLYQTRSDEGATIFTVPAKEGVYIDGKKTKKFRKIKYNGYIGWASNPNYTGSDVKSNYTSRSSSSSSYKSRKSYSGSSKTVKVKGYTRKDGTYVKPHTRSAPKRRH